MTGWARGFRLHITGPNGDTTVYDGAQFPSGIVVTAHPYTGLVAAATTLENLVDGRPEYRVDWAPGPAAASETGRPADPQPSQQDPANDQDQSEGTAH